MIFDSDAERTFAKTISRLVYTNPFLPERIECERAALGDSFVERDRVWNALADPAREASNVAHIGERAETLVRAARQRLDAGAKASAAELEMYEELVFYVLYHQSRERLATLAEAMAENEATGLPSRGTQKADFYAAFARDAEQLLTIPGRTPAGPNVAPHLFACFFQIRRAFHHIFANIVGRSIASAQLRAAAWQSIFTHDVRRYFRVLYDRMGDFTTLVTGGSGTGKELVARAIGLSRYVPFDPKTRSFEDFSGSFHALNLSALSPTLIESELFGHRRGAFTGALEDRAGWLETCPAIGTVFLDEIGELDPLIQVKLLRVLQTRTFQRLGDTQTRLFKGKIIAATNRDLAAEMAAGRFRKDFYYRLCSDMIRTPGLNEQLQDSPKELKSLVLFIAHRLAGPESESLADEVVRWIERHLGPDYPWPGNFRELEQCVRNVLIRHEYHPPTVITSAGADLVADLEAGRLTADQLLRRYCKLVYASTRSYEETARRLELDRRTVKSKVVAEDEEPEARS